MDGRLTLMNNFGMDDVSRAPTGQAASGLNSAVLLMVFNRPETTRLVFEKIKEARPVRLYIASDGPRPGVPSDALLIEAVREITNSIDWVCDASFLLREKNMGCGPGVKSAIDWFFERESEGIILEDDTVPTNTFFRFSSELLEKYRFDDRIGMVAGTNFLKSAPPDSSYFYAKNKETWGWATWRRAWRAMDYSMSWRTSAESWDVLANTGVSKYRFGKWQEAISQLDNGLVSAWDYQWVLTLASQNQLCIFPRENLVANIGFGPQATHTTGKGSENFRVTGSVCFPLKSPEHVVPSHSYDLAFERANFKKLFGSRLRAMLRKKLPGWLIRLLRSARKGRATS